MLSFNEIKNLKQKKHLEHQIIKIIQSLYFAINLIIVFAP